MKLGIVSGLALAAVAISVAAAPGGNKPPKPPKGQGGDVWICSATDGGIIATWTSDGEPIWYGLTAQTAHYNRYQVGDSEVVVQTGAAPAGNCIFAGTFPIDKKHPILIQEISPRRDAGHAVSAIDVSPSVAAISVDTSTRQVVLSVRRGSNTVVFTHRVMCVSNWANGGVPLRLGGNCAEGSSGMSEINIAAIENGAFAVDAFSVGTRDEIPWSITKTVESVFGSYRIEAVSVDGVRAELYMEF